MKAITVRFDNKKEYQFPFHTPVKDMLGDMPQNPSGLPWIACLVNNDVASLSYPVEADSDVRLLTTADAPGWHIYARTASFILAKSVRKLFPQVVFSVRYALGSGFYCLFEKPGCEPGINQEELLQVKNEMLRLLQADIPIERQKIGFAKAVELFEKAGQSELLNLLKFRNPPRIVLHVCEEFYDLAQGPLAPTTGVISQFNLIEHASGLILQLPDRQNPTQIAPFVDEPHRYRIYHEHLEWGKILGVTTVGRLNELIMADEIQDVIKVAEALHEKKTALVADRIHSRRHHVRIIQIAGPSSAGKTTFSKRLSIELKVNGIEAITLSLDDYFVSRDKTPRDENGQYDFEHINALDLELFNQNLNDLIAGLEVNLPTFSFETKSRIYNDRKMRLREGQIIIVEGIHGLNPKLTSAIPDERKYLIYVNAMTQLGIDSNNRISTTDNRLIRRMVRDHKFRGHSALDTLRQWPSVRRGEERWIFPYQSRADVVFNSALDYELAVLKPLAEPLLMQVKPTNVEYAEARRLAAFLLNFLGLSDREVPRTSILREYIGESSFKY